MWKTGPINAPGPGSQGAAPTWGSLPVGGGGNVTAIDIAPDGTKVVSTDTYGCYLLTGTTWNQLVTQQSMPNFDSPNNVTYGGTYAIKIAYSNTSRFYQISACGMIFRSDNRGQTWTNISLSLTTNGATAAGNATLHFASVPSWLTNNMFIYDATVPGVISSNPDGSTSVSSSTGTTVVMDTAAQDSGVGSGDTIIFTDKSVQTAHNQSSTPFMAVDPINQDFVLIGMPSVGIVMSTNAGASWSKTSVPASTSTGSGSNGNLVAFDPSGGTSGGKTKNIYAASYGNGLYFSGDSGVTWNAVTTTGAPTTFQNMVIDPTSGVVFIVDGGGANIYKYTGGGTGGTWSTGSVFDNPSSIHGVAIDPVNNSHIWLMRNDMSLWVSVDTGATFNGHIRPVFVTNDAPWLSESGPGANSIWFDPTQTNPTVMWAPNGVGVFYATNLPTTVSGNQCTFTNGSADITSVGGNTFVAGNIVQFDTSGSLPSNLTAGAAYYVLAAGLSSSNFRVSATPGGSAIVMSGSGSGTSHAVTSTIWTSETVNIENLDTNWIVSTPNNGPAIFYWDRPAFVVTPGTYPSLYGPSSPINNGWSGDVDGAGDVVVVMSSQQFGTEASGYSTNNGASWTLFSSQLSAAFGSGWAGGCIAASTQSNYVAISAGNGSNPGPYYTTNSGGSWTASSVPGSPGGGYVDQLYYDEQPLAADRVTAGKFYLILNSNAGAAQGVYTSTDNGATFVMRSNPNMGSDFGGSRKLRTVPGNAGHVMFSICNQNKIAVQNYGLWRSTDGLGVTWNQLPNIINLFGYGFGKAASGHPYPAIYALGYASNTSGTPIFTNGSANIAMVNSFAAGQVVMFSTTGSLPSGFSVNTLYYVLASGLSGTQFQVTSTFQGSLAITAGSGQSGVHTCNPYSYGVWRSIDGDQATPTWQKVGDGFPGGFYSGAKSVEGDLGVYGSCYIATGGNGVYWGRNL
jgi:hypothetical protein